MTQETFVNTLYNQVLEYIEALNKHCKDTSVNNEYIFDILDGGKPLNHAGSTIKHYKEIQFRVNTPDGNFMLYHAYAPLKNKIEGTKKGAWLLKVLRDFMYQCITNFAIMAHASILESERKKEDAKKELQQIGSLVDPEGKPLMTVKK